MKTKYSIEKKSDGRFTFIAINEKVERHEMVKEEVLREHYNAAQNDLHRMRDQLGQLNKALKDVDTKTFTKTVITMAENMSKAQKYMKYLQDVDNKQQCLDNMERVEADIRRIESVLPVVKRNKIT